MLSEGKPLKQRRNEMRAKARIVFPSLLLISFLYLGNMIVAEAGRSVARSGLTDLHVNALVLDSSGNPYAGTTNGVFHLNSDGITWSAVNTGLSFGTGAYALTMDSSGNLYAGTVGGGGGSK